MNPQDITYINEASITNKTVLVRVDFNVSLASDGLSLADDARIRQSLPTIHHLLRGSNKLILVSHLNRPQGRDPRYSLKIVAEHLQKLIPEHHVVLVEDFLSNEGKTLLALQKEDEIILLENIRFYKEEKERSEIFAKELAALANVYVNDAFGVCHRNDTSIVGVPKLLPSFGGLLLKKEIAMISSVLANPKKPFVAILGGAKISTKIAVLGKLIEIADYLLVGGEVANTFLKAKGLWLGKSLYEEEEVGRAKLVLRLAREKHTQVVLPADVVLGGEEVVRVNEVSKNGQIFDIGPETQAVFGNIIQKAKTIVWSGPVGYFEDQRFRRGTDFVYYAITQNQAAVSIVGGGDTLAAISKKEHLEQITHISTGGGAMLEFIEKGTLPGIEALRGRGKL